MKGKPGVALGSWVGRVEFDLSSLALLLAVLPLVCPTTTEEKGGDAVIKTRKGSEFLNSTTDLENYLVS